MNKVKFVNKIQTVYPIDAEVLSCTINENDPTQNTVQGGNINLAVKQYGKGRSAYIFGLYDSFEAFRLIYKTLLWASRKENKYQEALSSNPNVDCYYYEKNDKYALLNNVEEKMKTIFYDINGKQKEVLLDGYEIKWID